MTFREAVQAFRGHAVPHFRIVERKRLWFALSGALVVLSLLGLLVRGLNFSIDFKGGSLLRYPCPNCATGDLTTSDVSSTLSKLGFNDAEVQIVNGDTLSVRTRSLTTAEGRPATILVVPNTAGASEQQLRAALAAFGHAGASITVSTASVRIKTRPLSKTTRGIVLTYDNSKTNVTTDQVRTTLQGLGYPGAEVQEIGTTVVVRFTSLPVHPPVASPSPSPEASASASATPSASPTPVPSPTPTLAGRAEVLSKLATQAGITADEITLTNTGAVTEAQIIDAVASTAGTSGDAVKRREITGKEQQRLLQELADQAGTTTGQINRQDVGPTWGSQISSKAVKGLIIFLILVTLYIAFRFEWKMAAAAQSALLHDIVITAGIYALVGRVVTPATVIAILTILGYSLYDTVVIFDKVKENTESQAMVARETYTGVVDISLNQVLMRSVNTSLVVLLPILSLLLIGGSTLKDFAFALFVGVAIGAYSSIFLASPMLALLKEREPKNRQIAQRAAAKAAKPQLRPVPATDGGDGERDLPASAPAPSDTPRARPQPGPSSRPKKKRKTTAAQRRRR